MADRVESCIAENGMPNEISPSHSHEGRNRRHPGESGIDRRRLLQWIVRLERSVHSYHGGPVRGGLTFNVFLGRTIEKTD